MMVGVIPERALLDPIERHQFTMLQLEPRSRTQPYFVFPAKIEGAIEEHYTVVQTSANGLLLEPRRALQ
jgi:hypothetical protein